MTKCCINVGANCSHKEAALMISGIITQLYAPAIHINITFYWPILFRNNPDLPINQNVFFFFRFSSTSQQVNQKCWGPQCKSRTHKTLTGDQPTLRTHQNLSHPQSFIFPRFYFLHFAELCPKKWQLGLPRITITIIRITTTAPAGKTLTARRSHVWSLLIMASNNSNNNNNNWQQLTLINNNNSCWSQWLTKSFNLSDSD